MGIDDINSDNLDLDLNVNNQERWEADLKRAREQAQGAASDINRGFNEGEVAANKFSNAVLSLSKRAQTLAVEFQKNSTKEFGKDLEFVNITSREAVTQIALLQGKLASLDALMASSGEMTASKFERRSRAVRQEVAELERQLVLTRQLETLQTQSRDPRSVSPIGYTDVQSKNLLAQQASLASLEGNFARIRDVSPGTKLEGIRNQAIQALGRISVLRTEVLNLDKSLIGVTNKTVISKITSDARNAEAQIAVLKRELIALQLVAPKGIPRPSEEGQNSATAISRGLGLPDARYGFGPALAIGTAVLGVQKFIQVSGEALERAKEQYQANRRLSASASELGVTYGFLAGKNTEYAAAAGLSIVKTTELTQKVAQLAARTAQPNRLDKTVKGLLDLGAARGLDAQELITVTNQIITGQDEAYKKLGIKNPQILFKEYAEKQGRSTESLSQLERQRIYQDEILKKAALFSGAAKDRMESVDGQIAKTSAAWENMLNTLSTSFAEGRGVFEFLKTVDHALKNLGLTADETKEKLSQGISPTSLASKGAAPGIYDFLDKLGASAGIIPISVLTGLTNFSSAVTGGRGNFGAQVEKENFGGIAGSLFGNNQRNYEEELLRRNNAFLRIIGTQKTNAAEEAKRIEERDAAENIRRQGSIDEQRYGTVVKRNKNSVDVLEKEYRAFLETIDKDTAETYFNSAKKEEIAYQHGQDVSKALVHGFESALKDPKSSIRDFQRGLDRVNAEDKLTPDDKEKLQFDFEGRIKTSIEQVNSFKKELQSLAVTDLADQNPFVKLFSDFETAERRAQDQFGKWGPDIVSFVAGMDKAHLQVQIGQARFLNSLKVLDFEQQYKILKDLSYQQTDGFQRKLAFTGATVDYTSNRIDLQTQIREASFYSERYNPYNIKTLNQDRFGYTEPKFNIANRDALDAIKQLSNIDINGTGLLGQGTIAEAVLKRIPDTQLLLPELNQFGERRQDAQQLLEIRTRSLRQKQASDDEKFQELIRNQVVAEKTRKFAQEKIDLVNKSGLNDSDKAFAAQQVLSITGELGSGELTSSLRNSRLQAQQILAEDSRQKETEATERMVKIVKVLDAIGAALTNTGIKIDTSTNPLLDVRISNSTTNASSTLRPNGDDVQRRNQD